MGISFVMAKAIAKSTSQQLQGVGISNIGFISPNILRFTLSDNSTKDVVLTGLNEFTTEEKTKLASLDSNILTKFSLDVDGNILYNGKILNSITKSNINGNIVINGTETKIFDDTTINNTLNNKIDKSSQWHGTKAEYDALNIIDSNTIYITTDEYSQASKVESSSINGNIKIDGVETNVYKTKSGITSARPTPTYIGQVYFDTTLNKPIWCKDLTPTWVDAMGVIV